MVLQCLRQLKLHAPLSVISTLKSYICTEYNTLGLYNLHQHTWQCGKQACSAACKAPCMEHGSLYPSTVLEPAGCKWALCSVVGPFHYWWATLCIMQCCNEDEVFCLPTLCPLWCWEVLGQYYQITQTLLCRRWLNFPEVTLFWHWKTEGCRTSCQNANEKIVSWI